PVGQRLVPAQWVGVRGKGFVQRGVGGSVDIERGGVGGLLTPVAGRIRFDVRWMEAVRTQWVAEVTVRVDLVHVCEGGGQVSEGEVTQAKNNALQGIDAYFNQGNRLLGSGHQLHVQVEFVEADADPHAYVRLGPAGGDGRVDQQHLPVDASQAQWGHEFGHYLGLPDQARSGLLFHDDQSVVWVKRPGSGDASLARGEAFRRAREILADDQLTDAEKRQQLGELGYERVERKSRGHHDDGIMGDAVNDPQRTPKLLPRHAYVIETTIGSSVAVRPSSYDHLHNPDTPLQAPRPTGFTPEQLRAELDELTRETRRRNNPARRNNQQNQNNQGQGGNRQNQGNQQNQNNQQNRNLGGNRQNQGNQNRGNLPQQNNQQRGNQGRGANQQAQQQNVGGGAQQVVPAPGQVQQRGPGPTWADLIDTRVQRHIFTGDP